MEIRNETRDRLVVPEARWADSFWLRLKGLMFTAELPRGRALVLSPCNSVHMFFMRYALDLIFTDAQFKVVALRPEIKPWRCTWLFRGAVHCIEANPGVIAESETQVGDQLRFLE